MFKYYNLNRNPNLGFFKHSNDDYNFININKLASNNPYIGYFSQFKNKNYFGLLPENSKEILPYKKGNPNIITGNANNLIKDISYNLYKVNNFSSLNRLLFSKNTFFPNNSFKIKKEKYNNKIFKMETDSYNSETMDTDSYNMDTDSYNSDSVEINSEISDDLQTVDLLNVFNSLYQLDTKKDSIFINNKDAQTQTDISFSKLESEEFSNIDDENKFFSKTIEIAQTFSTSEEEISSTETDDEYVFI